MTLLFNSYDAYAQGTLADGRPVAVNLTEFRSQGNDGWTGQLFVQVDGMGGYTALDGSQVNFDRNLGSASAVDVPVTLQSWSWDPVSGPVTQVRQVTASVTFTGTGPVTRTNDHSPDCGDGLGNCQASVRVGAARDVAMAVIVDGVTGTGAGSMNYDHGVDSAIRTPVYG